MNKLITPCIFIIFILTGCYEFEELSVSKANGNIIFFIDKETLSSNNAKNYIIQDFGVAKDDCENDCIMWEIVRKEEEISLTDETVTKPLIYGETIINMDIRHEARQLKQGKYTAGGTVTLFDKNNNLSGKLFHTTFELIQNDNGSINIIK